MAWLNATPEKPAAPGSKTKPVRQQARREDIESVLGRVIMPDVPAGQYLLNWFFEFGPVGKDGPVTPGDVKDWGEVLGIRWKPWQARLFVRLSREYATEQHRASGYDALPPWDGAVKMWQWVRNQLAERELDRQEQMLDRENRRKEREKARNGHRK